MWYHSQEAREIFSKQAMYVIKKLEKKINALLIDRVLYMVLGFLVGGGFAAFLSAMYIIETYGG